MVGGDADDFAKEDHMIPPIMLGIGSAFEARSAARKNGNTASAWLKIHAFELVDIAHGKVPGQVCLVFPENMYAEMLCLAEGCNVARSPA